MEKLQSIILDIENDLSGLGKIDDLELYEHSCYEFFEPYLYIHKILPEGTYSIM